MRTYHLSTQIGTGEGAYWRVFNDKGKLTGYIRSYQGNKTDANAPMLYVAKKGEKITDDDVKEKTLAVYETMEQARDALFSALPKWLG